MPPAERPAACPPRHSEARDLGLSRDALARYLEGQPFVFAAYTEQEVGRAAAAHGH